MEEEAVGECPVCGGYAPLSQLSAHVDECLERGGRSSPPPPPPSNHHHNDTVTASSSLQRADRSEEKQEEKEAEAPPKSSSSSLSSSSPSPSSASSSSSVEEHAKKGREKGSGGGLLGFLAKTKQALHLVDAPSPSPSSTSPSSFEQLKEDYEQLRGAVLEGSLPCCTQYEAIQLAALQLAVEEAEASGHNNAHKLSTWFKKKKKRNGNKAEPQQQQPPPQQKKKKMPKKVDLSKLYAQYWIRRAFERCDDLQALTLVQLDIIWDRTAKEQELNINEHEELEHHENEHTNDSNFNEAAMYMKAYLTRCYSLEYYGMQVFPILEQKTLRQRSQWRYNEEEEEDEEYIHVYTYVPKKLGITANCSLVKMNPRNNEVEIAWKVTQIKNYTIVPLYDQKLDNDDDAKAKREERPKKKGLLDSLLGGGSTSEHQHHHTKKKTDTLAENVLAMRIDFGTNYPGKWMFKADLNHKDFGKNEGGVEIIYQKIQQFIEAMSGKADKDKQRMNERLALYRLDERSIIGDGNCQMRAIADQLWNSQSRHAEVRKAVVRWLRDHPFYEIREGGKDGPVLSLLTDFLETDYHEDWSAYCDYMNKNGTWGDQLTLLAAAEVYSVTISVLSSVRTERDKDDPWTYIEPTLSESTKTIFLGHWHERHYTSLSATT